MTELDRDSNLAATIQDMLDRASDGELEVISVEAPDRNRPEVEPLDITAYWFGTEGLERVLAALEAPIKGLSMFLEQRVVVQIYHDSVFMDSEKSGWGRKGKRGE